MKAENGEQRLKMALVEVNRGGLMEDMPLSASGDFINETNGHTMIKNLEKAWEVSDPSPEGNNANSVNDQVSDENDSAFSMEEVSEGQKLINSINRKRNSSSVKVEFMGARLVSKKTRVRQNNKRRRQAKVFIPRKRRKVFSGPDVKDRFCWICHKGEISGSCGGCPRSFHIQCLGEVSSPDFICSECLHQQEDDSNCKMTPRELDRVNTLLMFALQRLKSVPGCDPFLKPVPLNIYPKYMEYICHPLDLSSVEYQLKKKHYMSLDSFFSDVKWILHNCIVFNSSDSPLTTVAKKIVKLCREEISEIRVCPDCYYHAHIQPETWFTETYPHVLIWARMRSFPFWPGKAMRCTNGSVDVRFFGAHDRAWVPLKHCFLYSTECPGSTRNRRFRQGIPFKEIQAYISKVTAKFGPFRISPPKTPLPADDWISVLQAQWPKGEFTGMVTAPLQDPLTPPDFSLTRKQCNGKIARNTVKLASDEVTGPARRCLVSRKTSSGKILRILGPSKPSSQPHHDQQISLKRKDGGRRRRKAGMRRRPIVTRQQVGPNGMIQDKEEFSEHIAVKEEPLQPESRSDLSVIFLNAVEHRPQVHLKPQSLLQAQSLHRRESRSGGGKFNNTTTWTQVMESAVQSKNKELDRVTPPSMSRETTQNGAENEERQVLEESASHDGVASPDAFTGDASSHVSNPRNKDSESSQEEASMDLAMHKFLGSLHLQAMNATEVEVETPGEESVEEDPLALDGPEPEELDAAPAPTRLQVSSSIQISIVDPSNPKPSSSKSVEREVEIVKVNEKGELQKHGSAKRGFSSEYVQNLEKVIESVTDKHPRLNRLPNVMQQPKVTTNPKRANVTIVPIPSKSSGNSFAQALNAGPPNVVWRGRAPVVSNGGISVKDFAHPAPGNCFSPILQAPKGGAVSLMNAIAGTSSPLPASPASSSMTTVFNADVGPVHREVFESLLRETGNMGSPEATIKTLQLENERLKWKHAQEMTEVKKSFELQLLEHKKLFDLESQRLRQTWEQETKKTIEEVKKKQWFVISAQMEKHWPMHVDTCSHSTENNDTPMAPNQDISTADEDAGNTSIEAVEIGTTWVPQVVCGNDAKPRRTRCHVCSGCKEKQNCGTCRYCLNKRMRKACIKRRCISLHPRNKIIEKGVISCKSPEERMSPASGNGENVSYPITVSPSDHVSLHSPSPPISTSSAPDPITALSHQPHILFSSQPQALDQLLHEGGGVAPAALLYPCPVIICSDPEISSPPHSDPSPSCSHSSSAPPFI
ncbi:unnamed protein product [Darwinula stevensoni]|uniref:Protein kinase C-binding protein 1 n=1 Tax=Darwinula stevensoni TaxID=69355 RepID=A0A7R9A512_9CRUS|nr:unnamed protein product [Darwinula stevensoni]CAG0891069.1 unnamed protein product [Darwinula stevensoni]